MDVTQATKYYQSLIHSHGCLLFSIEQEKSALRQRKDNAIAVEMTKVNTIVGIPFGKESGRNVAIFGNGDGEGTDTLGQERHICKGQGAGL